MFDKAQKSYTDALGKTNRIVEGTIIKGNIESIADFRLDGHLIGNFNSKGKLVVGPAGLVHGNIFCAVCSIFISLVSFKIVLKNLAKSVDEIP